MLIELDNIRKNFGGVWALEGVSARFEPGQVISLLGANGFGA
jgi:ABC-type sugar transport system ATPase subunit